MADTDGAAQVLLETKGCVWLIESAHLIEKRGGSVKIKVKVYSKGLATECKLTYT